MLPVGGRWAAGLMGFGWIRLQWLHTAVDGGLAAAAEETAQLRSP